MEISYITDIASVDFSSCHFLNINDCLEWYVAGVPAAILMVSVM